MPLPEPTDLDKAGHLKFEELEASLRQLNKEIEGTNFKKINQVAYQNRDQNVCVSVFFFPCKGVEQKANQVIAASEETHLEPFKGKMESFFVQGNRVDPI